LAIFESRLLTSSRVVTAALPLALCFAQAIVGQELALQGDGAAGLYSQLRAFSLGPDSATVENLVLERDRVVMTFVQGTFYFPAPVQGKVRGAVFVGTGKFHSDVPPLEAELANVRRLLNADDVSSDFKTAVLQFADDTYDVIGKGAKPGAVAPAQAQRLATDLLNSLLEEEGSQPCLQNPGIHCGWRAVRDVLCPIQWRQARPLLILV
jgi:hypothetical protein